MRLFSIIFVLLAISLCLGAQPETNLKLQNYVQTLSDDQFEGRFPGTKGELLAAQYISKSFESFGLSSFREQYIVPFSLAGSRQIDSARLELKVGKRRFVPFKDFFPLSRSANGKIKGRLMVVSQGASLEECEGKILAFKHIQSKIDPSEVFSDLAQNASDAGAAAIIIYSDSIGKVAFNLKKEHRPEQIPMLFLTRSNGFESMNGEKVKLNVLIQGEYLQAHNVAAFKNNHSKSTIVIGAHLDHLGRGQFGGSRQLGESGKIHNGADDNASGIAALLYLAESLVSVEANHNYLFIAFSGEELGLLGSGAFLKQLHKDELGGIKCMINLDMVGRLDSERSLIVSGTGTTKQWDDIILRADTFNFKLISKPSGIGPSDHTSFYHREIPAIHLFTGPHAEYHTPNDDYHLINYAGLSDIGNFTLSILSQIESIPSMQFQATKNSSSRTPKFSATLGIMPSYSFEGEGLKIDGVSLGKAAADAGLVAGDIIIKMDQLPIKDIYNYMDALSKYKDGDSCSITIIRNEVPKTFIINFK